MQNVLQAKMAAILQSVLRGAFVGVGLNKLN